MKRLDVGQLHMCRECLNRTYGIRLRHRDCKYWYYLAVCDRCGQARNIVTGLNLPGRWKLFRSRWIR